MIEIIPSGPLNAVASIPGSKYIANRLLPIASLAKGNSILTNLPVNEDIRIARKGLESLGVKITDRSSGSETDFLVEGTAGRFSNLKSDIYTAGSGTFSRFIAPLAALSGGEVFIHGNARMSERPMDEIFQALRLLGRTVLSPNGRLPATLKGGMRGGSVTIDGSVSSQYLSALLISGVCCPEPVEVKVSGELVSKNYVLMTIDLMRRFGAVVEERGENHYYLPAKQIYQAQDAAVEVDPVSSSYFMAAAAISKGKIEIPHWNPNSKQGEVAFPKVLEQMGCSVKLNGGTLTITGTNKLKAVDVNMSDMPDVAQTLAAVACFAEGTTRIHHVAHLRFKESDRIGDTARELRKSGITVKDGDDYLEITGGKPNSATFDSHGDHRMAMSLALLGLVVPGIKIDHEDAVEKSFPDYFERMRTIGLDSKKL
jgi:3-phosphoshikimate 1-carboxyvinyltransferase